ncbi:PD-(D/E)XK motif protein [Trinickia diaoshuihuensis]|uniref:PD-(D/E)XK motif protein n=1 Tax=Trinickia diaoshuihuensis TaxID=2292265 RepID=UPI001F077FF6|nr:PD-(D/E)XK motif protein [Trinickia diaoshuihuensis]
MQVSVWQQFQALKKSNEGEASGTIRCGVGRRHLLLKGERDEPILLLATARRRSPRAPIKLKHVSIQFDSRYEVTATETGQSSSEWFCKIGCDASSASLHGYFVELLAATANALPGPLDDSAVDEAIEALMELFRKMEVPSRASMTGLWGELLLINASSSPQTMVDAWHVVPTDDFDFSTDAFRIDVKSTASTNREHEFSLRQVRSGRPDDFIASVVLRSSADGLSVLDLARRIAPQLTGAGQAKLWQLVIDTLGDDAESTEWQTFDVAAATASIMLVPAIHIPAPSIAPGDAQVVSEVRFRARIAAVCSQHAVPVSNIF